MVARLPEMHKQLRELSELVAKMAPTTPTSEAAAPDDDRTES
jgi:hypothetical protein